MRRVVQLVVALLSAAVSRPLPAQGTVSGQLALTTVEGSPRGRIADAVVYLEPRRGGAPVAEAPATVGIAMRGREFLPHVQVVGVGGSVAFPNDDPFSHNVFSNTPLGGFDLGLYRKGASRAARFDRAGVYPIYCNIHHRMVSFVVAVPSAYAAQPGDDGSFSIRGVPAGAYVLHAWHEQGGEVTQPVTVTAQGLADVRLVLDERRFVPEPHLNKFGLPYTATRADRY